METDMADYKNDFLQELYECLDIFNQSFVDLENGDSAAVDEIFRVTHTIKGMAGFLAYKSLGNLCHSMEEVLCSIKSGDIKIDRELIDIMLSAVDRITEMAKKIENENNDNVKIEDLLEAFGKYKVAQNSENSSLCLNEPVKSPSKPPETQPVQELKDKPSLELTEKQQPENLNVLENDDLILNLVLSGDCALKDVRASLIIESLREVCTVTKIDPEENSMDSKFDGCFTAFLSGDRNKIEGLMGRISEIKQFNITCNKKSEIPNPVSTGKNAESVPGVGCETTSSISGAEESDSDSNNPNSEVIKSKTTNTKKQETIRVNTTNLDNIMNLVGELVINKGRLLQISQKYGIAELEEATGTLDKSISSLQDEVMRTRMVKIEKVFSKFPRMVRDLSRKLDKNIDFEVEGQDTELDRTILDEMNDPLVHLVRNAVDHGIENAQDRIKAGKNENGHIKLSAKREKNNVIIEIEDDGNGLDTEVIRRKAIEKGILFSSDADSLSEDEIRAIIFLPGFSTKDSATEISGRGVGMDVVKTAVEKLGGKVKLYSKKGEYTRIRINLPPTVAIIKSLLVEVGSETYAIPISNVVKALSVDDNAYKYVKGSPLLYINDRLVPILELKETFNVQCEKLDKQIAIVVEKENEEVGLIVDSIIDQQEIVIKPLTNVFSNSTGFTGVTILGDGRVIPILDVSILIRDDIDD